MSTPISVFTGFLGAGKTSLILALLHHIPPNYSVCLLKNEFGDLQVDSQLAKQSNLAAVNEIINGCMCCVLVGQMKNALLEIKEKFNPDRIFVETSGSAFPATLAFQIRELERETDGGFKLDAIVTVVDAEQFIGYEDISPTAKMQASYTDIIVINKWEHISERALDVVMDHLHTLNDLTPMIRCNGKNGVDPNLIFGLDSKLFTPSGPAPPVDNGHHNEVETITVSRVDLTTTDVEQRACCSDGGHLTFQAHSKPYHKIDLDESALAAALGFLSKESVWRVKGFVRLASGDYILNWAFGRYDLTPLVRPEETALSRDDQFRFSVMGERGEVRKSIGKFLEVLKAEVV